MPRVHGRRHDREEEAVRGLQVVARARNTRRARTDAGSCAESADPVGAHKATCPCPCSLFPRAATRPAVAPLFLSPHASDGIPRFTTAKVPSHPAPLVLGDRALCCSCSSCLRSFGGAQFSSEALRELLRAEMTRVSDSVYVLQISPVRLRLLPGSISFDSAYVTTDTIRRAAYPRPAQAAGERARLPAERRQRLATHSQAGPLRLALSLQAACRIGAQVAADRCPWPPTRAQGARARASTSSSCSGSSGCPPSCRSSTSATWTSPTFASTSRGSEGPPAQRVALQKFSAHFVDVVIDPQQPVSERRPLFSQADRPGRRGTRHRLRRPDRELQAHGGRSRRGQLHPHRPPGGAQRHRAASGSASRRSAVPGSSCEADSVRFAGIDLAQLIMRGQGRSPSASSSAASTPPSRPTPRCRPVRHPRRRRSRRCMRRRPPPPPVSGSRPTPCELIDGTVRYTGHRPGHPDQHRLAAALRLRGRGHPHRPRPAPGAAAPAAGQGAGAQSRRRHIRHRRFAQVPHVGPAPPAGGRLGAGGAASHRRPGAQRCGLDAPPEGAPDPGSRHGRQRRHARRQLRPPHRALDTRCPRHGR